MGGFGKGQQGQTYRGSCAILLGFGPADSLICIDDGQNIVWPISGNKTTLVAATRVDMTGAIYRSSAMDSDGKTVLQTKIGTMRFYWGTSSQTLDPLLAQLKIDQGQGVVSNAPVPAYNGLIYVVMDNVKLGSAPTAPRLYFTMSRFSTGLAVPGGISRVQIDSQGAGYLTPPTVQIDGDGTGASAIATIKDGALTEITVTEQGTGYTAATVSLVGGINTGAQVPATATATVHSGSIKKIAITNGGQNYATVPAVNISGDGTGASATAEISNGKVTKVTLNDTGSGYTTATVSFDGGFAVPATAEAMIFHETNGDSILPEAIYDLFTNPIYGLGINAAGINVADFLAAAIEVLAEDLGVSPYIDRAASLREIIGQFNPYLDSFIYQSQGRIGFKLVRPTDLTKAVSLNEDDFTEELAPDYQGLDKTWSMTRLTFTDQTNQWKSDSEPYDNRVIADNLGYSIEKEVGCPHVIRRDVAKRIAKRVGIKAAHPPVFYRTKLLPLHASRNIGDVVLLSYEKFGLTNVAARIMEKTIGAATKPEVDVLLMLEQTRSDAFDYLPPTDFLVTPSLLTNNLGKVLEWAFIPTQPRLMVLPPDLLSTHKDGWLTAFNRQLSTDLRAQIWFTFDPSQSPYKKVMTSEDIPGLCAVQNWHKCNDARQSWIVRVVFANQLDYDYFTTLISNNEDVYFVFGRHDVQLAGAGSDQEQVTGFWGVTVSGGYFRQIDAQTFDVQIDTGQFSWPTFALEPNGSPSNGPSEISYAGTLAAFAVYTSNSIKFARAGGNGPNDKDLKRRVKVALINHKKTEPLEETFEANYDFNDTTMSASGTYNPDWGLRTPTSYELYDALAGDYFTNAAALNFDMVIDIDEALLRFYDGVASTDDQTVFSSINQILGAYLQRADGRYNIV